MAPTDKTDKKIVLELDKMSEQDRCEKAQDNFLKQSGRRASSGLADLRR